MQQAVACKIYKFKHCFADKQTQNEYLAQL